MFLLPPRLRRLLKRKKRASASRVYSSDEALVKSVREIAQQQGRLEEEVLADFARSGRDQFFKDDEAEARWDSLSGREQEVTALACLGYRNYEIAGILGIAPETVKTHLQNIFNKFGLRSRKELRLVLNKWQFAEWWNSRHA
jgi:DNA-binding CsgD family transcriptional regulator